MEERRKKERKEWGVCYVAFLDLTQIRQAEVWVEQREDGQRTGPHDEGTDQENGERPGHVLLCR